MTNYEYLMSMPEPVLAEWLCDINKCDTCWFKDKKDEFMPGKCTWYWLRQASPLDDNQAIQEGTE